MRLLIFNKLQELNDMAKTLILIRHAKSSWSPYKRDNFIGDDHARPLNKRGKLAAASMASHLGVTIGTVDQVFSSSAIRATQTCKSIILNVRSIRKPLIKNDLYTFESEKLLDFIRNISNDLNKVIVIGHNPAIQKLSNYLISPESIDKASSSISEKYPTCGVTNIQIKCAQWNQLTKKCGYLINFLTPKSISEEFS